MLLDHDNVDSLGVFEGEESEASRASSCAVSHHGALNHLAELGEVVSQGFYTGRVSDCLFGYGL